MELRVDLKGKRRVVGAMDDNQSAMLLDAEAKIIVLESKAPGTATKAEMQGVLKTIIEISRVAGPTMRAGGRRGFDLMAAVSELQGRLTAMLYEHIGAAKSRREKSTESGDPDISNQGEEN